MPKSAAPPDQPLQERSAARPATPRAQRRPTSHSKSAAPPYRRRLSAATVGGDCRRRLSAATCRPFPTRCSPPLGQRCVLPLGCRASGILAGVGRLAALLVLIPAAALAEPGRSLVVVLDPGHGGAYQHDGAHGRGGLIEKDVALAVALRTKEAVGPSCVTGGL